jgi:hypothetical protein
MGVRCAHPPEDAPVIWLENVARAFFHDCAVGASNTTFAWLGQELCSVVMVAANDAPPLIPSPDSPDGARAPG